MNDVFASSATGPGSMVMTGVAFAALTLASCAALPGEAHKPQLRPASAYQTDKAFAAPAAAWPSDRWWEAYGDRQLTQLIDEALDQSPTLAQAVARLQIAEAQTQVARAATLPQLNGHGDFAEEKQTREVGFPPFIANQFPKGWHSSSRLTLDAGYDLDLFGKNRAALAAAVSEAAASKADLAQARLTLSTAVAQAYANLIRLSAEREAGAEAVRNRQATSELTAERVRNGLDTRAELKQAEAATPSSQADVEALDEQILLTRHQIAALLGAGPDRGLAIVIPNPASVKAFGLPPDLRLHLLGRRPDIVAARLRAEAASKRIDEAYAAFFPDVTLSAYVGQQALPVSQLFSPAAAIGSFGPAITLPIFQGGRLRGEYHGAQGDYAAAVDAYDATLAQALQDVADAAASVQSAQKQLAERRAALDAGEQAYAVAKERYEGGLSSFVSVLAAEDAVIIERRAFADAQTRVFTLEIALVRALGGGFSGA